MRTGPEPLRRTDYDLDFDAKDHHVQPQEQQTADHVCASSEEPAGTIPAGFRILTGNHEHSVEGRRSGAIDSGHPG